MSSHPADGVGRSPSVKEDGMVQLSMSIEIRGENHHSTFIQVDQQRMPRESKPFRTSSSIVKWVAHLLVSRRSSLSPLKNLQKEGRALVGEGILMKVCRKKPKQRAFFLFNDILVYGRVVINGRKVRSLESRKSIVSFLVILRQYSQQKLIPLHEMKVSALKDSPGNSHLTQSLRNGCFSPS